MSTDNSRPGRSSLGRITIGSLAVVALVAGAFVAGRVSSSNGTPHAAAEAQPASKVVSHATTTTANVPTVNIDEAAENRPDQPLDPATRAKLAADLVTAREVAAKYPTVADAVAAGLVQAGKFAPGAGAHYIDYGNTSNEIRPDGSVDPTRPGAYIYDGISPTSRLVGLMYISLAETPPAGFPGPNDHWHRHSNLCIKYTKAGISVPFAPDRDVTRAQCDIVHGEFMQKTVWMVHAWVVPGWESPKGVFSHSNPDLTCADGTMNVDKIGFCKGT